MIYHIKVLNCGPDSSVNVCSPRFLFCSHNFPLCFSLCVSLSLFLSLSYIYMIFLHFIYIKKAYGSYLEWLFIFKILNRIHTKVNPNGLTELFPKGWDFHINWMNAIAALFLLWYYFEILTFLFVSEMFWEWTPFWEWIPI